RNSPTLKFPRNDKIPYRDPPPPKWAGDDIERLQDCETIFVNFGARLAVELCPRQWLAKFLGGISRTKSADPTGCVAKNRPKSFARTSWAV
ncbi:hypothetical protein, partial [Campylobacter sp.]|uniref:hypothetical protein n=1 Tax=Campylobacter sp. TaxID=205 RepID=UPI002A82E4BC